MPGTRHNKVFWIVFLMTLLASYLFQEYLERSGNSDVLGLWYTVLCASMYSFIAALINYKMDCTSFYPLCRLKLKNL